jgi:hypothetical protein
MPAYTLALLSRVPAMKLVLKSNFVSGDLLFPESGNPPRSLPEKKPGLASYERINL